MKFEMHQGRWLSLVDELEQEQFNSLLLDFLCVFSFSLMCTVTNLFFSDVSKVSEKSNLNTVNKRQKFPFVA